MNSWGYLAPLLPLGWEGSFRFQAWLGWTARCPQLPLGGSGGGSWPAPETRSLVTSSTGLQGKQTTSSGPAADPETAWDHFPQDGKYLPLVFRCCLIPADFPSSRQPRNMEVLESRTEARAAV